MTVDAFIFDSIRTPRGRGKIGGSLHGTKPISLVVGLLHELRKRNPGLDADQVEDIILGCVSPLGEQGGNIARTAALVAGYETSGPGFQLNRFCASGLEAVNVAAEKVRSGWQDLIVAGGVESMSRVPMGSDGGAWFADPETSYRTSFVPQGVGADLIATLDGFRRADVDLFAVESQDRALKAIAEGRFAESVVPVVDINGCVVLQQDEFPRPGTTLEALGTLKPSFAVIGEAGGFDVVALQKYHWVEKIDHVHTAGNSSGIVDGAAVVLIGSERIGNELGLVPRARIVSVGVVGTEPTIMLTGPAPSAQKAIERAGLTFADIDLFEVNEALPPSC